MDHSAAHSSHPPPPGTTYNINLQIYGAPKAAESTELSFVVTEQKVGDALEAFDLLHDRLMHLIIVDESLSYFAHVHPGFESGTFTVSHVFPEEGRYKLWAEVQPTDHQPVLAAFRLTVGSRAGAQIAPADLSASPGYGVALTPAEKAPLHEPVEIAFEIADPQGNAVTDLEPLMAAGGHCVIISADLRDFIHVHPVQEVEPTWRGGPKVSFLTTFHRPVRHKVWGQFQHAGSVITAAFDIDVEDDDHH